MVIAGVDIGYGWTKAVSGDRRVSFPSVVGLSPGRIFQIDPARKPISIAIDGREYLCGRDALKHCRTVMDVKHRDYVGSEAHRCLLLHALSELFDEPAAECTIVTGLPMAHYRRFRENYGSYERTHRFRLDGVERALTLRIARVIPQPVGTLFDLTLSPAGQMVEVGFARRRVGVIDVGFWTTDVILLDELELEEPRCGGVEIGLSALLEDVRQRIEQAHGRTLTLREAEEVLRTGRVRIYGEERNAEEEVRGATEDFASVLTDFVRNLWGSAEDVDYIVLTGGGVLWVKEPLRSCFPQARSMAEPVFANARGFFKYAVRLTQRG